jgi:hypothetical protein
VFDLFFARLGFQYLLRHQSYQRTQVVFFLCQQLFNRGLDPPRYDLERTIIA